MSRWFSASGLFIALVTLDRLTKAYFENRLAESRPVLLPGLFELVDHKNFGIIANIPIPRLIIILISLIVMGFVIAGLVQAIKKQKTAELIALTLILAGATGNLWDRIQWGYVFDWLLLFGMSAINLADIAIGLGLILLLIGLEKDKRTKAPSGS